MKIIIDASAAVELVLKRAKASAIGEAIAQADLVMAPDLYAAEVTNVFWKCYAFEHLPMPDCEAALSAALALPDEFFLSRDLAAEALALSCLAKMPAYDMIYAVLARRSGGEILTLDGKLIKVATQQGIRVSTLVPPGERKPP